MCHAFRRIKDVFKNSGFAIQDSGVLLQFARNAITIFDVECFPFLKLLFLQMASPDISSRVKIAAVATGEPLGRRCRQLGRGFVASRARVSALPPPPIGPAARCRDH